jgi:translation initiation factor IF-2
MPQQSQNLTERSPIVVIMGHIDHGKSTLLDHIRKSNVVAGEAGGITQHISAYEVVHKNPKTKEEKRITFLDTPGHAAFQGMRARGAKVADIAILVVSAEDGVKPQTLEAYRSIQSAGIPYIVAINKIDKPNANVDKTKVTLSEAGIYVEGYGGDVPWVAISAKAGTGVDELLDVMLLVAEMAELRGDASKPAEGVVIESRMDTKKGATATVVITDGTLEKGMFVSADNAVAPVRVMENFLGKPIDTASFSSPIRLIGWSVVPDVGALVHTFSEKRAAEDAAANSKPTVSTSTILEEAQEGVAVIPVIIKSDVAGTLEAIELELGKLTHERVRLKVVQKGVGAVSEGDIKVALGAKGLLVIGFNVKGDALAADLASRNDISINTFDIIYKLTEWVAEVMKERAPVMDVAETTGELRVLKCFSQQKDKQVIGGKVTEGALRQGDRVKIMRRGEEIGEGRVVELQCQKLKTSEVAAGNECGLCVESKAEISSGDDLSAFSIVKK